MTKPFLAAPAVALALSSCITQQIHSEPFALDRLSEAEIKLTDRNGEEFVLRPDDPITIYLAGGRVFAPLSSLTREDGSICSDQFTGRGDVNVSSPEGLTCVAEADITNIVAEVERPDAAATLGVIVASPLLLGASAVYLTFAGLNEILTAFDVPPEKTDDPAAD